MLLVFSRLYGIGHPVATRRLVRVLEDVLQSPCGIVRLARGLLCEHGQERVYLSYKTS